MKNIYFILAIIFLCGAGVGFYLSENYYPSITFAMCSIIVPLAIGGILLCIYLEKRKKNPSYWGTFFVYKLYYDLNVAPALSPALITLFKISLICSVVIFQSQTIFIFIDTDFFSSHRFFPA